MLRIIRGFAISAVLFAGTSYFNSLRAQNINEEFGEISMSEMTMKKCPLDTSAEAYVLLDKGRSIFVESPFGGFDIIYERHCRIKILSENAFEFADISIPLYQENNIYEKLEFVEAVTYNLDDSVIENADLDPKNVYEEKVSSSVVKKKFAFPKVKAGSVIEYKYRISTPYVFNLPSWQFQWEIPVRYSEYEVHMIPFYNYTYILQGASKFDVYRFEENRGASRSYAGLTFNDMNYTYGMRNLPAFHTEPFVACPSDYILKLIFQLSTIIQPDGAKVNVISTWSQLNKDILRNEYFGRFLKSGFSPAKKLIESLNIDQLPPDKKIKWISDYVKINYKWDEDRSKYTDKSIKKFMDDKSGNSAEINLFLVALLDAAGIEAYPVLLSTRDHGQVRYQYPFLHYFNNVIVAAKINNNYTLLDATCPIASYNHIPVECINDKGLVIKKDDPVEWVNLVSEVTSLTKEKMDISLADGTARGSLNLSATDYDAYDYFESFFNKPESVENEFLQKGYTTVDSIILDEKPNSQDTFNMKLRFSYKLENTGNFIYLSPLLHEPILKSPFKSPERTYPVDFTCLRKKEFCSNITIPDGFTVQSVPAKLYYDNKDYYVFYEAKILDKRIQVNANYMFKRTVFQSNEYRTIKFIMQNIVDKFNEKIVLKKV